MSFYRLLAGRSIPREKGRERERERGGREGEGRRRDSPPPSPRPLPQHRTDATRVIRVIVGAYLDRRAERYRIPADSRPAALPLPTSSRRSRPRVIERSDKATCSSRPGFLRDKSLALRSQTSDPVVPLAQRLWELIYKQHRSTTMVIVSARYAKGAAARRLFMTHYAKAQPIARVLHFVCHCDGNNDTPWTICPGIAAA